MYEVYKRLCSEKGVTSYQVSKATGVPETTLSDWKHGRSTPKLDKMYKIAKFFDVPVTVFIEGAGE